MSLNAFRELHRPGIKSNAERTQEPEISWHRCDAFLVLSWPRRGAQGYIYNSPPPRRTWPSFLVPNMWKGGILYQEPYIYIYLSTVYICLVV